MARKLKRRDPLAEAVKIASDARDASIEIDWAENPEDDREAALRLATIRVIEREQGRWGQDLWGNPKKSGALCIVALCTLAELRRLVPEDSEFIGDDLYDAIERWELARIREDELNKRNAARELRERAMRELNDAAAT